MGSIRIRQFIYLSIISLALFQIAGCQFDPQIAVNKNGFPDHIAPLMLKCSNPGCHNSISKNGAGGLSLASWDEMFEGGSGGATTVPFSTKYSTLLYYTNTDSTKGLTLLPTMPYNAAPLSATEYDLLVDWIKNGAPDRNGNIKFSPYSNSPRLYICNKGCDVVTIMDAASGIAMRYIEVGKSDDIEEPSVVKVSPDKKYWYVTFNKGTVIQKYRASDDVLVGEIDLGLGVWSSLTISDDSRKAFITDNQFLGKVNYLDLENMQILASNDNDINYPLNTALSKDQTKLYITSSQGNFIYKMDLTDIQQPIIEQISLDPDKSPNISPSLNPYDIIFSPDESKYFVTCARSSELRILKTSDNSLIDVINTGSNPGTLNISETLPQLFFSCFGASGTVKLSSIYVINYLTHDLVADIYAGHESKGIALDEASNKLYVANRNVSDGGPNSHHESICAGKNGYISVIDLNTFNLIPGYRKEISVDPYAIDIVK